MNDQELSRRDFNALAMAALGGAIAGAAGCGNGQPTAPSGGPGQAEVPKPSAGSRTAAEQAAADVHVCRGLNACKGQGKSGTNACAGQGDCATPSTLHECAGQNACKGQGGCGAKPAQNSCKAQGMCKVPLMDEAWEKARRHFEEQMNKAGRKFGAAPKA